MYGLTRTLTLLGIMAATVASILGANALERIVPEYRNYAAAVTGILFGLTLYQGISAIANKFGVRRPADFLAFGNAVKGLSYSFIIFAISLVLLIAQDQLKFSFSGPPGILLIEQIFFQLRPALIEEIGFRFGLVLLGFAFFGRNFGLLAGSLPFGVLHLLNFMSGQEVIWEYIVGTAIAGLYLSLVFMNYGLVAAIVAHYSWNVLAATSAQLYSFKQEQLEGGTGTLILLLLSSAVLLIQHRNRPADSLTAPIIP